MTPKKLFTFKDEVTFENYEEVMQQVIALELATIPTYLSTYYSINRAQDQDKLYTKIHSQLSNSPDLSAAQVEALAQELKVDVLVYANRAAALTMSVVIEEMLHLALSCNVKQATCADPKVPIPAGATPYPDIMSIGASLEFPAELPGHVPEFPINTAKLSLNQLTTFLQIESPEPFTDPTRKMLKSPVKYQTIGQLYEMLQNFVGDNLPGPYPVKPQLLPPETKTDPSRPFYSQNSINTVHYDREHNPHFANNDESGGLVGVQDSTSAIAAMQRIIDQGEGRSKKDQHTLVWGPDNMPVPLEVVDGEAVGFLPGDYDDASGELAHFAKFLDVYSVGRYYKDKFNGIAGLDEFFTYLTYGQDSNPKQADYDALTDQSLALCSKLGNATFTYILLMVETCYYKDESTQFDLFMYGIHKSMIWLLSEVGNYMHNYEYTKDGNPYTGALTFEAYDFSQSPESPKTQMLALMEELSGADPNWSWVNDPKWINYWPSLPDVGLDHSVAPNVPAVPSV